jgi:hypothetical protein
MAWDQPHSWSAASKLIPGCFPCHLKQFGHRDKSVALSFDLCDDCRDGIYGLAPIDSVAQVEAIVKQHNVSRPHIPYDFVGNLSAG